MVPNTTIRAPLPIPTGDYISGQNDNFVYLFDWVLFIICAVADLCPLSLLPTSIRTYRLVFLSSSHRGIRHYWGVRVRGQHTKTTGRRGKIVAAGGRK